MGMRSVTGAIGLAGLGAVALYAVFTCAMYFGFSGFVAPAFAEEPKSGKVLRHVVLFKFKDDLKPEQIKEVVEAFAELPKKIDTIKGFEWGTDVSVENLAAGYTHCFIVTFADEKGREAYLPHPAHKAFVDIVKPRLAGVLVVDFWAEK